MSLEEELKARAQAESQELATLLQATLSRAVVLAGENAVLRMKLDAATASEEKA